MQCALNCGRSLTFSKVRSYVRTLSISEMANG